MLQTTPGPVEIIGGEPSAPGAWPAVGAVTYGVRLCTGTLIAPDLVLTAAHCFPPSPGAVVQVGFGRGAYDEPRFPGSTTVLHPDFCGEADCGDDTFDFAFIRLDEPITDVEPLNLVLDQATWDAAMDVGAEVTLVGFGEDENEDIGTKRELVVPIDRFTGGGLQFWTGSDDGDSCEGDSGGPALVQLDGKWLVAGVLSSGSDPCGQGAWYGVPHAAAAWLASAADYEQEGACYELGCIDTAPPGDGCGCISSPRAPAALWWLLPIAWASRRRRRS